VRQSKLFSKNEQIKKTRSQTREKRKNQICKTFEVKIDESKLNKVQLETLRMYFIEAKWIYNNILRSVDIFNYDDKTTIITKLNKDRQEEKVVLKYLTPTLKQTIVQKTQQNISALSKSKKNGNKVGRLKFKSEYNSIELRQYFCTHKIIDKNRIKIIGIKKPIFVRGLQQIPQDVEFANAKLLKKPDGFYIKITTYIEKETKQQTKKDSIGIDFGIKHNLTTSEGQVFDVLIAESERLKCLQRKFSRQKKGSNNWNRTRNLIKIEYQKISNKKLDRTNKIVHELTSNYHNIFIQDENLRGWKKWFGKQVQHSCMGLIKIKLTSKSNTYILDQFEPTTKLCHNCGHIHKEITLNDRTFKCPNCGYEEDRDIKAAKTILKLGMWKLQKLDIINLKKIGMEHTKSSRKFPRTKPEELKITFGRDTNKLATSSQEDFERN
jgi:transposase